MQTKTNSFNFLPSDKLPYCGGPFSLNTIAIAHDTKSVYHNLCNQNLTKAKAYLNISNTELKQHLRATCPPPIKIKNQNTIPLAKGNYSDHILNINYTPIFLCPKPKLGNPCPLGIIQLIHIRAVYYDLLNKDQNKTIKLLNITKQRLIISNITL